MYNVNCKIGSIFISEPTNRQKGYLVVIESNDTKFVTTGSISGIRYLSDVLQEFLENKIDSQVCYGDTLISDIPLRKGSDIENVYGMNIDCFEKTLYDYEDEIVEYFKNEFDNFIKDKYQSPGSTTKFVKIDRFSFDDDMKYKRESIANRSL